MVAFYQNYIAVFHKCPEKFKNFIKIEFLLPFIIEKMFYIPEKNYFFQNKPFILYLQNNFSQFFYYSGHLLLGYQNSGFNQSMLVSDMKVSNCKNSISWKKDRF